MHPMSATARALALTVVAALAAPACADDAVPPAPPAVEPATMEPAVIESAQLDPALIEQGAALELFGLSSAATTALIVLTVAVILTVTSSSDAEGIPP
jgi:hypothetical protein